MPLFHRPDGELVRDLDPVRKVMPLILPTRSQASMYHPLRLDLHRTLPWLEERNARAHGPQATLFHLWLWAHGRNLHAWPRLNRFAVGGRLYQRHTVSLSFSVKPERSHEAPFELVELVIREDESLDSVVERVHELVHGVRQGHAPDLQMRLISSLPVWVVGWGVRALMLADAHSLLPASAIEEDAMFCSMLLANLGSVGLDATFHHLNEYGTASLFGTLGVIKDEPVAVDGELVVHPVVDACYTMDERAFDGLYAARAIAHLRSLVEDPG